MRLFISESDNRINVTTVHPNDHARSRECVRIPNHVIYEINALLAETFQLYEVHFSKKKADDIAIGVRGKTFIENFFLNIRKLDSSYISAVDFDEDAWRKTYVGDVDYYTQEEYEYLRDCFAMEAVIELRYFGTKNLNDTLSTLAQEFAQCRIRKRDISLILAKLLPVYVVVIDHEDMDIFVHYTHLRGDIMKRLLLIQDVTLVQR